MSTHELVKATEAFVKETLKDKGPGHDWWHVDRVRRLALRLAKEEGADLAIVELGALLHDIADHKFHGGDYEKGAEVTREFLESQNVDEPIVHHVCEIVRNVSFSKGDVPSTIEGKCVQDADRLDTLGAIGIARVLAYSGHVKRPLHVPAGEGETSTAFAHFHEKILLLKGKMNTASAKRIARDRHAFVEEYLKRFLEEWEGIR